MATIKKFFKRLQLWGLFFIFILSFEIRVPGKYIGYFKLVKLNYSLINYKIKFVDRGKKGSYKKSRIEYYLKEDNIKRQ